MELRHIRSFLSLAKTLNFSRTAEIVHLSQPALSLQIQALEKELGVTLVERAGRRTVLTAAGTAFQREAAGGLTQLGQAMQSARLAAEGKLGVVRIGFVSTAGTHIVPRLIREYRALKSARRILAAKCPHSGPGENARGRRARPWLSADAVYRRSVSGSGAHS